MEIYSWLLVILLPGEVRYQHFRIAGGSLLKLVIPSLRAKITQSPVQSMTA